MTDFEDRVKCYLTGIALEAQIRDSLAQLDEHIETFTSPGRENPFTGEPVSESRPAEAEATSNSGHSLMMAISHSLKCADGTRELLAPIQVVGSDMQNVSTRTELKDLQGLRAALHKANNLLYGKLFEAGL